MISYHFLNDTTRSDFFTNDSDHGAGDLWSNIPNLPSWKAGTPPYPLIMADSRPVGSNLTTVLAPNSTVYEITPHEFGSWDPSLSAMVNVSVISTTSQGKSTQMRMSTSSPMQAHISPMVNPLFLLDVLQALIKPAS